MLYCLALNIPRNTHPTNCQRPSCQKEIHFAINIYHGYINNITNEMIIATMKAIIPAPTADTVNTLSSNFPIL